MLLTSKSTKGNKNIALNCEARNKNGDPITCRQLAYYATKKNLEDYQPSLSTIDSIVAIPELYNNNFDVDRVQFKGEEYYLFDLNKFGSALAKIAQQLEENVTQNMLFYSDNHTMAIVIHHAESIYIIKFYDPNFTAFHAEATFDNTEAIEKLQLSEFIEPGNIEKYFLNNSPGKTILSVGKIQIGFSSNASNFICMTKDGYSILSFLIAFDLKIPAEKILKTLLAVNPSVLVGYVKKYYLEKDGLFQAFVHGHVEMIRMFFETILDSQLSETKSIMYYGASSIFDLITHRHQDVINTYLDLMLNSKLKHEEKVEILCNQIGALRNAIILGYQNNVVAYTKTILESELLSDDEKIEVLKPFKLYQPIPAYVIKEIKDGKAADAFVQTILELNLTIEKRKYFLFKCILSLSLLDSQHTFFMGIFLRGLFNAAISTEEKLDALNSFFDKEKCWSPFDSTDYLENLKKTLPQLLNDPVSQSKHEEILEKCFREKALDNLEASQLVTCSVFKNAPTDVNTMETDSELYSGSFVP